MRSIPLLLLPLLAVALSACDASEPGALGGPSALASGGGKAAEGQRGVSVFTYALTVDGAGVHAAATADAVLGPAGTGVLGAPAPGRTGLTPHEWIPGQHRDGVFVLRGVRASGTPLLRWYAAAAEDPEAARATITIAVLNPAGRVIATWVLHRAVPTKISSPELNAGGNEVAIEEIELEAEGIKIEREEPTRPCEDIDVHCR